MTPTEERERYEALAAKLRYWRLIGESVPTTFAVELIGELFDEMGKGLVEAGEIDPKAVGILVASMDRAKVKVTSKFQQFADGVCTN